MWGSDALAFAFAVVHGAPIAACREAVVAVIGALRSRGQRGPGAGEGQQLANAKADEKPRDQQDELHHPGSPPLEPSEKWLTGESRFEPRQIGTVSIPPLVSPERRHTATGKVLCRAVGGGLPRGSRFASWGAPIDVHALWAPRRMR